MLTSLSRKTVSQENPPPFETKNENKNQIIEIQRADSFSPPYEEVNNVNSFWKRKKYSLSGSLVCALMAFIAVVSKCERDNHNACMPGPLADSFGLIFSVCSFMLLVHGCCSKDENNTPQEERYQHLDDPLQDNLRTPSQLQPF